MRRAALPARIALRGSRAALRIAARIALRIAARVALRIAAWNLSMCRPPFLAAVYALRRFFMRGGGNALRGRAFCIPGLNPGGTYSPNKKGTRRGGVPPTLPADLAAVVSGGGGLSGWLPADRAVPEAAGGLAVLIACLPCL